MKKQQLLCCSEFIHVKFSIKTNINIYNSFSLASRQQRKETEFFKKKKKNITVKYSLGH